MLDDEIEAISDDEFDEYLRKLKRLKKTKVIFAKGRKISSFPKSDRTKKSVFKVLSTAKMGRASSLLEYITQEHKTQENEQLHTQEKVLKNQFDELVSEQEVLQDWADDKRERINGTDIVHAMLSVSADETNTKAVAIAVKNTLQTELQGLKYVYVAHNDTNNLHFHITINKKQFDNKIFSIDKVKIRAIRATFSENLIEQGLNYQKIEKYTDKEIKLLYATTAKAKRKKNILLVKKDVVTLQKHIQTNQAKKIELFDKLKNKDIDKVEFAKQNRNIFKQYLQQKKEVRKQVFAIKNLLPGLTPKDKKLIRLCKQKLELLEVLNKSLEIKEFKPKSEKDVQINKQNKELNQLRAKEIQELKEQRQEIRAKELKENISQKLKKDKYYLSLFDNLQAKKDDLAIYKQEKNEGAIFVLQNKIKDIETSIKQYETKELNKELKKQDKKELKKNKPFKELIARFKAELGKYSIKPPIRAKKQEYKPLTPTKTQDYTR